MQIISIPHHCLYFKLNKKKYLYGLTHSLLEDPAALRKLKPDHIVLPSFPFIIELSLFLWQLQVIPLLPTRNLIVQDQTLKKRLQLLIHDELHLDPHLFTWDFFKQNDLNEQNIIKILQEEQIPKPLREQPHGFGYNAMPNQLQLIVGQKGRSVIFIRGCDVFILDPAQQIQNLMRYYGLPLTSLKAVILTNSTNLNWFECLLKVPTLRIISEQSIYEEIKKRVRAFFFWGKPMFQKRVKGKIISLSDKWHRFNDVQISFSRNKSDEIMFWDIFFGRKRIRIHSHLLDLFPSQIVELRDLEYFIMYDVEESIKKQMQKSPEVYRKKVIFNRVDRKYNNKYFVTLNKNAELLTVQAHQSTHKELNKASGDEAFQFKQNDINARLNYNIIQSQQTFNSSERAVYLRSGYLKDTQGNLYRSGQCIQDRGFLMGEGRAIIMHEPDINTYFYHGRETTDQSQVESAQTFLSRVKQNSFIDSIRKKKRVATESQKEEKKQKDQSIEKQSQWDIFNQVCQIKTFEAGSTEPDIRSCFYFVVKGRMKIKTGTIVANKNMAIGNIKPYYSSAFEEQDEIEVVKDTWAIQIQLKALQDCFFRLHPERMYQLFVKPIIFS